jgi:hypothetical protein
VGKRRFSAFVSTARPEKLTLDASASAIPVVLKVLRLLDALATPATIGTSDAYVSARSRSPRVTIARPTVLRGSAALNISTKDGAAIEMAAFVSRNPHVYEAATPSTSLHAAELAVGFGGVCSHRTPAVATAN